MIDWSILIVPAGAVIRGVAGWAENAFADGEISKFEWKQLGETVLRVGIIGLALLFGLHLDPMTATGAAIATDFGLSAVKNIGVK